MKSFPPTRRQFAIGLGLAPALAACQSSARTAEKVADEASLPRLGATVILVRHTEKANNDSDAPLNPAGEARAAAFGEMFAHAGVTGLVHTGLIRTRDTLAPLAARTGMTSEAIAPGDVEGLVRRLASAGPDEVIAVAGHSNTIPAVAWAFGVLLPDLAPVPEMPELPHGFLPHGAYDRVHVLTPGTGRGARLLELRYGAPS